MEKTISPGLYINDDNTIKFEISGITHLSETELIFVKNISVGDSVKLESEPTNPYDPNAILVRTMGGIKIGYVNRNAIKAVGVILNNNLSFGCRICQKTEHQPPYIWVLLDYGEKYNRGISNNHQEPTNDDLNEFGENIVIVDGIYNVRPSDRNFDDIDEIREEDNRAIYELIDKITEGEIADYQDADYWLENDIKPYRIYKSLRFLKMRMPGILVSHKLPLRSDYKIQIHETNTTTYNYESNTQTEVKPKNSLLGSAIVLIIIAIAFFLFVKFIKYLLN